MTSCPYGFWIVGAIWGMRQPVDHAAAFAGYARCDDRVDVSRESYLSAFQFGEDFHRLLKETNSTAGFSGPCWARWLWFDIDAEGDLKHAHREAVRLAMTLYERYRPGDDDLLCFFSGSKGFHVGLPTSLWSPEPSLVFHRTARQFAEQVAQLASVKIDTGIYDRVRAFRAPNSRHPKTGLYKRRFTVEELGGLSLDRILELSRESAPFDLPDPTCTSEQASTDWQAATDLVAREGEARAVRRVSGHGMPALNRLTRDFIQHGAEKGDRHRRLYSAAKNLGEFSCPAALVFALLEEPSLDSGLTPKEVRRQIECGLASEIEPSPACADSTTGPKESSEPESASGGDALEAAEPTLATDVETILAQLWVQSPAPTRTEGEAVLPVSMSDADRSTPPEPPPLAPLPPGAVGTGRLEVPCRCGSMEYVEVEVSENRTRLDCRKCGRFVDWGKWYDQGGPTS